MKKIVSKILIILIILIMLFEFAFSGSVCYAVDIRTDMESWVNRITSLMGGLISIKLWIFRLQATTILVTVLDLATNTLAESCGISSDPFFAGSKAKPMTPTDIFFNKYAILDVNFFEIENKSWIEAAISDDIILNLRKSVAIWYYTLRNIVVIVLLCVLIYVGIRMTLSTMAEDKSKYKQMLFDWICSLILIYVLQYIIIFTVEANNAIVYFLRQSMVVRTEIAGVDFVPGTYTSMDAIIGKMALQATTGIGMGSFIAIVALAMIVFQTIAFFLAYMTRMLKVGFLIIISPMISATYSIDKISDGKAQALNSWLKEFVYTILIQPFHIILYMAFANTAMALLSTTNSWLEAIGNVISGEYSEIINAVLVILCLKFVNEGEKIIRKIFNFQETTNGASLAAGAAVGLATLNMMKKGAQIGTKAAGVANKFGGMPTRLTKAFNNSEQLARVKDAFNKTGVGKMLQSEGFKNKLDKFNNNDLVKKGKDFANKGANFAKNAKNGAQKAITGYKNFKGKLTRVAGDSNSKLGRFLNANRNYLPKTLGLMGAAMSYATGTSGIMQAIGMGKSFQDGSQAYFENSESHLTGDAAEAVRDEIKENDEEYQQNEKDLFENQEELEENRNTQNDLDKQIEQSNSNIKGMAQHGLKREKDQTPEDALKAYEKDWALLQEKRENGDTKGAKALEDDMKSRSHSMFSEFENREKLKEQKEDVKKKEKDLLKRQEELEDKKRNIEKRIDGNIAKMDWKDLKKMLDGFDVKGQQGKIEKVKAEILKNIQNAMVERKMLADGKQPGIDSKDDYYLTDEEQEDAKAMQQRMLMYLDRSVMKTGENYDTRKAVTDAFGKENTCGNKLLDTLNEYKSCKRANQYVTNRDHYMQVGGEEERFIQQTIGRTTGSAPGISEIINETSG